MTDNNHRVKIGADRTDTGRVHTASSATRDSPPATALLLGSSGAAAAPVRAGEDIASGRHLSLSVQPFPRRPIDFAAIAIERE